MPSGTQGGRLLDHHVAAAAPPTAALLPVLERLAAERGQHRPPLAFGRGQVVHPQLDVVDQFPARDTTAPDTTAPGSRTPGIRTRHALALTAVAHAPILPREIPARVPRGSVSVTGMNKRAALTTTPESVPAR